MTDTSNSTDNDLLVRTLRDAGPYLLAHRNRIVVVLLPGALAGTPLLPAWLGDIILLQRVVNMRFALAFDTIQTDFSGNHVPVSPAQLATLTAAANDVRTQLESCLAQSIPDGLSGNGSVTTGPLPARAIGVINGVDLDLQGVAKKLPRTDADDLLATGKIVLLPPAGQSHDGQRLHLDASNVALTFATACVAHKLVLLVPAAMRTRLGFREMTLDQARVTLTSAAGDTKVKRLLAYGVAALEQGVERVHYLSQDEPGSMLLEFLSPNGIAAMLSKNRFDAVRAARAQDVAAILELITPSMASHALRQREFTDLVDCIDNFAVVARDDALIACASMEKYNTVAEFSCLVVRPDYSNQAYGQLLLDFFITQATNANMVMLLAVTTQASDWFTERGFTPVTPSLLPPARQVAVATTGAKVLGKQLD